MFALGEHIIHSEVPFHAGSLPCSSSGSTADLADALLRDAEQGAS